MNYARKTTVFAITALILFVAIATAETPAMKSPFNRIAMIGASVSAGFTESELFGGPKTAQYRLHHYLNAALLVPHEPAANFANAMFFLAPEADAVRQTDRIAKKNQLSSSPWIFYFGFVTAT